VLWKKKEGKKSCTEEVRREGPRGFNNPEKHVSLPVAETGTKDHRGPNREGKGTPKVGQRRTGKVTRRDCTAHISKGGKGNSKTSYPGRKHSSATKPFVENTAPRKGGGDGMLWQEGKKTGRLSEKNGGTGHGCQGTLKGIFNQFSTPSGGVQAMTRGREHRGRE